MCSSGLKGRAKCAGRLPWQLQLSASQCYAICKARLANFTGIVWRCVVLQCTAESGRALVFMDMPWSEVTRAEVQVCLRAQRESNWSCWACLLQGGGHEDSTCAGEEDRNGGDDTCELQGACHHEAAQQLTAVQGAAIKRCWQDASVVVGMHPDQVGHLSLHASRCCQCAIMAPATTSMPASMQSGCQYSEVIVWQPCVDDLACAECH